MMKRGLPPAPLWSLFALTGITGVTAAIFVYLGDQVPALGETDLERIEAHATFAATRGVEDGWVATAFPETKMSAPVAYLQSDFNDNGASQRAEFDRAYRDPPHQNPLQQALRRARVQEISLRESWVWALSKTERLFRDYLRTGDGPPGDPRLCLTMAEVMAEAEHLVDLEIREILWRHITELLDHAASRRSQLPGEQIVALEVGIARLRLLAAIRDRDDLSGLNSDGLGAHRNLTITAIRLATTSRTDRATRDAILSGSPEATATLHEQLADRAGDWQAALRKDAAEALAIAGLHETTASQRRAHLWIARSLLGNEATPEALEDLEASLGAWQDAYLWFFTPWGRSLSAAIAGILAGIALGWWVVQIRLRKALFTSFYRLEAHADRQKRLMARS